MSSPALGPLTLSAGAATSFALPDAGCAGVQMSSTSRRASTLRSCSQSELQSVSGRRNSAAVPNADWAKKALRLIAHLLAHHRLQYHNPACAIHHSRLE